jgi:hypothetical protein
MWTPRKCVFNAMWLRPNRSGPCACAGEMGEGMRGWADAADRLAQVSSREQSVLRLCCRRALLAAGGASGHG